MNFKFCPKCSEKLEFKKIKTEEEKQLICKKCSFIFYQNSKPTVSALILNNKNKIMLVRRAVQPFKNKWDIPGGFLKVGEDPQKGVKRELLEETGLSIKPLKIFGIFMDKYHNVSNNKPIANNFTLNIYYLAKILKGKADPASDISEIKWFSLDRLPQIAFKNGQQALDKLKKKFILKW